MVVMSYFFQWENNDGNYDRIICKFVWKFYDYVQIFMLTQLYVLSYV